MGNLILNYMEIKLIKEQILKEFSEIFDNLKISNIQATGLLLLISKALDQTREETLKEIIREYQDNELDGKDYDFYFSIRVKIDELNKLKSIIN